MVSVEAGPDPAALGPHACSDLAGATATAPRAIVGVNTEKPQTVQIVPLAKGSSRLTRGNFCGTLVLYRGNRLGECAVPEGLSWPQRPPGQEAIGD